MDRKKLLKIGILSLGVTAVAMIVAWKASFSQAAPPPPIRRVPPRLRPRQRPHARAVALRRRHIIALRRHPLVVRRVGGTVVIEQAGKVIRPAPRPVIVTSVTALKPVPTMTIAAGTTGHKIVRVHQDGQTPVLLIAGKETPVRLLGVDPAVASHAKTDQKAQADRFFHNLLVGEWVYLDYDANLAQQDVSGTPVAYLRRAPDGMLLNLEAIRQGYALAAAGYSHEHQKLFEFYEGKAQADAKGIWAAAQAPAETAQQPAEK